MKVLKSSFIIGLLGVAGAIGVAVPATLAGNEWVRVEDQKVVAANVVVAAVSLHTASWVIVHSKGPGSGCQEDGIIGQLPLNSGFYTNVSIPLNRPVNIGDHLFVTVHQDDGTKGQFEFNSQSPNHDAPVTAAGLPITAEFSVK